MLAVVCLAILIVTSTVPRLSRRFFVLASHRVLTAGMLVFAAEALYVNIARPFHLEPPRIVDSLGFAALLFSFAYVAVEMIVSNERRLLSIENELAIARQLQFSILPATAPEISHLRIAATYEPMTAVAGDFYEFLPVDTHRIGFLVADVSGHGVPAALIASMIKVATQSVNGSASDPGEVLRRLGNILSGHLRGQFVSAAYLWIDTETCTGRYSAAGHPPLLCWRSADASLTRIESNGLLFGVMPDGDYPVREIPLAPGDRLLLYTDGVTEPENASGEPFGDCTLEHILRVNQSQPAAELSARLLSEIRSWQPPSVTQQDDITLIVIDVL
jgi:phosphoserine phosphatase RsbU/P